MSIARKTKDYIVSRPAIHECLRRGIVNYSALAVEIQSFYGTGSKAAIIAAAIRYSRQLKFAASSDKQINVALRNSKLSFRSDMLLYVLEKPPPAQVKKISNALQVKGASFNYVEGEDRAIVCINGSFQAAAERLLEGLTIEHFADLVLITITQAMTVMKVQGVVARLYGLLAENGISPVESLLVGGEHLLYIYRKDLLQVMELIQSGYLGKK